MTANPLAESFRYNRWANQRLMEACRGLSDEQLDARIEGTFGPIRQMLMHVLGGQQTFVLRMQGRQHEGELTASAAWPGFDTLEAIALQSSDELLAIAEAMDVDDEVLLPYMGKQYRYRRSFFLTHALEHGVEHRTQIIATMAQIGLATPDLDGWAYAEAMGYGEEAGGTGG